MRNSNLLTVVVAAALMFANVACACAAGDMGSEPTAHHHAAGQPATDTMPCPHQDCDDCDELLDSCTTASDYNVVSADRDARSLIPQKIDLEGADLDLAFLDTGQIRPEVTFRSNNPPFASTTTFRVVDTPIRRKDQQTK